MCVVWSSQSPIKNLCVPIKAFVSFVSFVSLTQERQHQQFIGIHSRALAQLLGTPHIVLRALPVAPIEANRSQSIVTREEQLRLPRFFRELKRIAVGILRLLQVPLALMNLT